MNWDDYFTALDWWMQSHDGQRPSRVYVSTATKHAIQAEDIAHVHPIPEATGGGRIGQAIGSDWYEDVTMGAGFRFEEDLQVEV